MEKYQKLSGNDEFRPKNDYHQIPSSFGHHALNMFLSCKALDVVLDWELKLVLVRANNVRYFLTFLVGFLCELSFIFTAMFSYKLSTFFLVLRGNLLIVQSAISTYTVYLMILSLIFIFVIPDQWWYTIIDRKNKKIHFIECQETPLSGDRAFLPGYRVIFIAMY